MKKFTAILGAALMLLSLGACKAEPEQEHNAIVTAPETEEQTEASTEVKTTESRPVSTTKAEPAKKSPEETTAPASAKVVLSESFSITVPASWNGRYVLYNNKPDESSEEGSLTFISEKNKPFGGVLFTVYASSESPEEQFDMALPATNVGILEKDGEQKYVYVTYTTDCQYDYGNPENTDEYMRMQKDSYDMFDGIKGRNGWKYQPLSYAREYA